MTALRGRGDWAAVDDVWAAQPVSSEQVLHPELYPDEEPVEIVLPDVAAELGPGWVEQLRADAGRDADRCLGG